MQIVELLTAISYPEIASSVLDAIKNPETIKTLSFNQRLMGGLYVTLLGMGITFVALILLMFLTSLMDMVGKIGTEKKTPATAASTPATGQSTGGNTAANRQASNDEEMAIAITAALAIMLETSTSNFVVKKIRRVEDSSTSWSRAGLADQLQRKF